jgi:hypothetical protein
MWIKHPTGFFRLFELNNQDIDYNEYRRTDCLNEFRLSYKDVANHRQHSIVNRRTSGLHYVEQEKCHKVPGFTDWLVFNLIPIGGKGSNRNNFGFMARVGEEDDRWIVKDLGEEGRNVNSWHWVDKNVFPWTQSRLTSLFDNLELVNDGKIKLHIKKVDVLKGESILMNRKGKLRPFYELEAFCMVWRTQ